MTHDQDQRVRIYVFRESAETAKVPTVRETAQALGLPQSAVEESLKRLEAGHVLILAPGSTNIWAADPFCAVPSAFRVSALGRTYWGICIWDALGIPAALHAGATVSTQCGDGCGEEMLLEVKGSALNRSGGVVHFAVPATKWWDNIGYT